ncbi:U5 small nuclear ribonucleoprotein TSSC4 [Hyperolius riggenbachi]|uniref:U5 small nuclear ribonucleoprotein TSSC4 n=1 Tax=Hyperolius riggenbachi TaxID=752182 RepID=UPI0035A32042
MSESPEEENPPKPFSALSFETAADPGTLSLSDSDPALSDEAEVASVSSEEDDDEQVTRQESTQKASVQPFTLKGTDTGFSRRSFDIFGGLLDIQKSSPLSKRNIKGKPGLAAASVCETQASASDSSEQEATTKPSSTDRPALATTKRSATSARLPDYLAHPERWTKYSLEDVPDTSDLTNRNTALSFLTQLKHQKESKEVSKESAPLSYNQDSSSSAEGRILFTKPPKKCPKDAEKSEVQGGQIRVAEKWVDDGLEDAEALDQAETGGLGFHGIKKRSRKNIRPKAGDEEEEAL